MHEAPDQAGGEEAVIQTLVGGKHRRVRRLLDRVAKRLQPERLGPEKHLQHQEIDMQRGDQRDQAIGDQDHVVAPRPASEIGWTLACRKAKSAAGCGVSQMK